MISHVATLYVYYVATSYQRKKQFESFKKEMEGISDIDVVVDGANVGFANANRKVNRDHLFLNATNIEMVIRELQKVQLNPFVILHHYHIKHLLKTNPSQVNILEVGIKGSSPVRISVSSIFYIMYERVRMTIGIGFILPYPILIAMFLFPTSFI